MRNSHVSNQPSSIPLTNRNVFLTLYLHAMIIVLLLGTCVQNTGFWIPYDLGNSDKEKCSYSLMRGDFVCDCFTSGEYCSSFGLNV